MSSHVDNPYLDVVYPRNIRTRAQKRQYIREVIDVHGFNWHVFWVTASGFFTDSYNLFATNVILPSLSFCYWPNADPSTDTIINCMTLAGSGVGQILFGIFADRKGRNKLYGTELVIVIFSTLLVSATSTGIGNTISPEAWIAVFRFVMGIGIGAEYPLSAALCVEWASTKARARMMAAVFLMQPVGQLFAQLVGYWVLLGYDHMYDLQNCTKKNNCTELIDGVWRWTTGVGGIPAALAILFRVFIKDPGLYNLEVQNKDQRALKDTRYIYGRESQQIQGEQMQGVELGNLDGQDQAQTEQPYRFSFAAMRAYLDEGNWRYLLGTSFCWFLLDFSFYGLGMGTPKTLAKLWTYYPSTTPLGSVPAWNPNPALPNATIYEVLRDNSLQSIYTVSIASCLGSLLLVLLIDYMPRREFLIYSFAWLTVLFIVTGSSFFTVFHTQAHSVTIVLVALCHFSFNFGANGLTFIIPAELWPTRYRCTFHGVAAASGKAGSIVVQAVLLRMQFNGLLASDPNSNGLGYIFIIFGCVMALGALFAWAWIPAVQNYRDDDSRFNLPNKTLEELGEGYVRATEEEGQVIGFGPKFKAELQDFKRRAKRRRRRARGN